MIMKIRYMTTVVALSCQVVPWLIPIRHECKMSPFPLLKVLDTLGSTFTPTVPCPPDPPPHASHLGHQASRLQSWPSSSGFYEAAINSLLALHGLLARFTAPMKSGVCVCVFGKAKTVLIITRATLTSSVGASGIRCVYVAWPSLTLWLWSSINLQH